MDRFIRPQADEIALAYETKNVFQRLIQGLTSYGTVDPNRIISHVAPRVRHMAIQDQLEQIPCLAPIMMWVVGCGLITHTPHLTSIQIRPYGSVLLSAVLIP